MKLLAEKNGYRRHFTKTQWEVLGTDKCGWVLVPEEVTINVSKTPAVGVVNTDPAQTIVGSASQIQAPTPKQKRRKK